MKAGGEYGVADLESVTMKMSKIELSECLSKNGGQECASLGLYSSQATIYPNLPLIYSHRSRRSTKQMNSEAGN